MFQFSCRFAFLSAFRLSNWTPKITLISRSTHSVYFVQPYGQVDHRTAEWSSAPLKLRVQLINWSVFIVASADQLS